MELGDGVFLFQSQRIGPLLGEAAGRQRRNRRARGLLGCTPLPDREKRPEDRVQTARDVFNEIRLIKSSDSSTGVRRGSDHGGSDPGRTPV